MGGLKTTKWLPEITDLNPIEFEDWTENVSEDWGHKHTIYQEQ